jgi:hypothetical protein
MEIAALFNGATLDAHAHQDFYLFGMVGKFADDWIDIGHDVWAQSPNLLQALLSQTLMSSHAVVQPKRLLFSYEQNCKCL